MMLPRDDEKKLNKSITKKENRTIANCTIAISILTILLNVIANLDKIVSFANYLRSYLR